jgi:hypothetical protein
VNSKSENNSGPLWGVFLGIIVQNLQDFQYENTKSCRFIQAQFKKKLCFEAAEGFLRDDYLNQWPELFFLESNDLGTHD